jgi:hypothetical protein
MIEHSPAGCMNGEDSCITDPLQVRVTLDFVVINNHSLTQAIALCLFILNMLWCIGALLTLLLELPSLQC